MKRQEILRLLCIVTLSLSFVICNIQPVQAASEWAGITGSGNAHIIYESYATLNSNLNDIYPFADDSAYQIQQDAYQEGFTSNIDLTSCTLYYAENSSTWPTSWSSSSGTISNIGVVNDRCTFTLNLNHDTDYMFYIEYTRTGYPSWYGYPGVSSFTSAPTSQAQTYKIHRNSPTTYQMIRIDGKIGDWSQTSNLIGTDGRTDPDTTSFYLAWDQDNLYVRIEGGFGNTDRLNIGIDVNPGTNDLSGSNVTNGFAKAQFTGYLVPDYIIQSLNTTNLDKYTRSGISWGSANSIYDSGANLYRINDEAEIRIPRTELGSPSSMGVYFWLANSSDNMYTCYGVDKPSNCINDTDHRLLSALVFDNLGSGQSPTAGNTDYNASTNAGVSPSLTLRNLYVSNSTPYAQGSLTLLGNLTIISGATFKIKSGSELLTAYGDIYCDGSLIGANYPQVADIVLSGGNQTISGSGTIQLRNLVFDGTGTKTIANDLITTNIKIMNSNVTVNAGNSTITLYSGTTNQPLFINNGTFNPGTSTIAFRGYNNLNAKVVGASNTTFYDVSITCSNAISGGSCTGTLPRFGVDFRDQKLGAESRATITHSLTLNNSTFIADEEDCDDICGTTELDGTPIYANGSTLIYNNGGSFDSAAEWKVPNTIICGNTPGVPYNVIIQNGTTLNIAAAYDTDGDPIGEYAANSNKHLCGSLTIENGSTLQSTGGTFSLDGNWTNNGGFTHNSGTVTFNNTDTEQQILGSSTTAFHTVYNRIATGNLVLNDLSTNGASAQNFYNYGIYRRSWTPVNGQSHSFGLARLTIAIDSVTGSSPSIQIDRIDHDSSHKTGSWPTWGVGNGIYWDITPTNMTSVQADLSAPTIAGVGTGLLNGTANNAAFNEDDYSTLCRYTGSTWDCRNNDSIYNDNIVHFADVTNFSEWALGKKASPTSVELIDLSAESGLSRPWILLVLIGLSIFLLGLMTFIGRKRFNF
jgi:hypothetical protein